MKKRLLLIAIAVVTAFVCAFGFIACKDDEPDLSSVNGTYFYCMAELDGDGNIVRAKKTSAEYVFKDGKVTAMGQSVDYTLDGKDIVVKQEGASVTMKNISDGIYLLAFNESTGYCLIRNDVTPSFEVSE